MLETNRTHQWQCVSTYVWGHGPIPWQPDLAQDFLLGTPQRVFHDIDELVEVVQANINERIQASKSSAVRRTRTFSARKPPKTCSLFNAAPKRVPRYCSSFAQFLPLNMDVRCGPLEFPFRFCSVPRSPSSALLPFFWEGSPTKVDYRKRVPLF